jgi:histidinol-phosphate aminotransferase
MIKEYKMIKKHLEPINRFDPDSVERSGSTYLRLDMNEGVSALPDDFVKEVSLSITSEFLSTYPAYKSLKEKIAEFDNVKYENVSITNGSDCAIKYIFESFVSPGDRVVLTDPTFAMYPIYSNLYQADLESISYNNDLTFPFEKFINAIKDSTKLAVIVNPNNPTGSILEKSKVIEILDKAKSSNTLVVVDEAYYLFYPETAADLISKYNNLIITRTFSKVFGMAALRIGYALADANLISAIHTIKPTFDANNLGVLFAEKILCKPELLDKLISDSLEGKEFICSKFREANLKYVSGHANFILIDLGDRVNDLLNKLKGNKILASGDFKQDFLKNYLRITTASKEVMEKFWNVFSKLLDAS